MHSALKQIAQSVGVSPSAEAAFQEAYAPVPAVSLPPNNPAYDASTQEGTLDMLTERLMDAVREWGITPPEQTGVERAQQHAQRLISNDDAPQMLTSAYNRPDIQQRGVAEQTMTMLAAPVEELSIVKKLYATPPAAHSAFQRSFSSANPALSEPGNPLAVEHPADESVIEAQVSAACQAVTHAVYTELKDLIRRLSRESAELRQQCQKLAQEKEALAQAYSASEKALSQYHQVTANVYVKKMG
ncbi:MAG: hypothetical protein VKJ06_01130 [Vampirovibrionales bacterium]|nr:hypothetical protein [Vampirovibrionales bacterium]